MIPSGLGDTVSLFSILGLDPDADNSFTSEDLYATVTQKSVLYPTMVKANATS